MDAMVANRVLFVCEKGQIVQAVKQALDVHDIQVVTVSCRRIVRHPHLAAAYRVVMVYPGDDEADLFLSHGLRPLVRGALLVCTRTTREAHLLQMYTLGVDECIVLPITLPLLAARVQAWYRYVSRWLQHPGF